MIELAVILVGIATVITNLTVIVHARREIRKHRRTLSPPG